MNRKECIEILERFKNWNEGQVSVSLALHGTRTREDDIYDARRELVLKATKQLAE